MALRTEEELRAGVLLWQIASPIILVLGTIGNILSIIVLTRKKINKSASTVYLVALAVADLSILYIGLLRQWLLHLSGYDIRKSSNGFCKLHYWLVYVAADTSVWILTAVTIERVISTLCPFNAKMLCTQLRAKIIIGIIVAVALVFNGHILFGKGDLTVAVGNVTEVRKCASLTKEYGYFFDNVWGWIDLCKFSLIPFVILTLGNICIIYKVVQSKRRLKRQVAPSDPPNQTNQAGNKTSSMSMLLVTLNAVFIFCTLPVSIYLIGVSDWLPDGTPIEIYVKDPWWAFVNILMYTNNSINFILYCLSGSRFRSELKALFRRAKPSQGDSADAGQATVRPNTMARIQTTKPHTSF